MAVEIIRKLIDDVDGSEAQGTVEFSAGGKRYEIDLSEANTKKFWAALNPWIEHARLAGAAKSSFRPARAKTPPPPQIDKAQEKKIREWAKGLDPDEVRELARQGGATDVRDRGRVSLANLIVAFNHAHPTKRTAVKDKTPAPQDVVDKPVFSGAKS